MATKAEINNVAKEVIHIHHRVNVLRQHTIQDASERELFSITEKIEELDATIELMKLEELHDIRIALEKMANYFAPHLARQRMSNT